MKVRLRGMLLMMPAGWINRHQQDVITYLKEENKILREKLGTKRILLSTPSPLIKAWELRGISGFVPKGQADFHDGPTDA